MTASTVKSTQVSNAEAVPVTAATYAKAGGTVSAWQETIEAATTSIDETGDIVHMLRVPASVVPVSLRIFNDDLDTHSTPTLAADVGIYRADTGVVKDADALGTAITDLQAANKIGSEILHEVNDIANAGKTLWELAGYTSHPGTDLLISLTVTTGAATAAAGTITMKLTGTVVN